MWEPYKCCNLLLPSLCSTGSFTFLASLTTQRKYISKKHTHVNSAFCVVFSSLDLPYWESFYLLHTCSVASVVSDSLWPHGLSPARLLCPWDSPSKNTGVDCHFLLQGIFLTQGSNPLLLRWQADSHPGATREALMVTWGFVYTTYNYLSYFIFTTLTTILKKESIVPV